jgi:signal transduction histidine kinase
MLEAERLAAVGQTVAALSHHIKNILQGLMTGGEMVEQALQEKDETFLEQGWRIVRKNQGKVQDLVMDMLTYSKEREPAIKMTDLNALVRDVLQLMLPRAKELGVELKRVRPDDTLPLVPCDPEGIHRALLNIVGNALDAVEERPNPRLLVGTRLDLATGWVNLAVVDNGVGIPPEKQKDVFKPFVSSKGAKGTGLGLAVSRKILREHGGDIVAENIANNRGARFVLRFPVKSPFAADLHATNPDIPKLNW